MVEKLGFIQVDDGNSFINDGNSFDIKLVDDNNSNWKSVDSKIHNKLGTKNQLLTSILSFWNSYKYLNNCVYDAFMFSIRLTKKSFDNKDENYNKVVAKKFKYLNAYKKYLKTAQELPINNQKINWIMENWGTNKAYKFLLFLYRNSLIFYQNYNVYHNGRFPLFVPDWDGRNISLMTIKNTLKYFPELSNQMKRTLQNCGKMSVSEYYDGLDDTNKEITIEIIRSIFRDNNHSEKSLIRDMKDILPLIKKFGIPCKIDSSDSRETIDLSDFKLIKMFDSVKDFLLSIKYLQLSDID